MSLDSTNEKTRQSTTTQPMDWLIWATVPEMNSKGANAMMVVSTPNVAGTATRFVPAMTLASV